MVSSITLGGCAIPKPDSDLCVVNAPAQHQKCYNVKRDYDDDGRIKPGATPTYKPAATIEDLNKNVCLNEPSWTNMKTYLKQMRKEYEDRCQ